MTDRDNKEFVEFQEWKKQQQKKNEKKPEIKDFSKLEQNQNLNSVPVKETENSYDGVSVFHDKKKHNVKNVVWIIFCVLLALIFVPLLLLIFVNIIYPTPTISGTEGYVLYSDGSLRPYTVGSSKLAMFKDIVKNRARACWLKGKHEQHKDKYQDIYHVYPLNKPKGNKDILYFYFDRTSEYVPCHFMVHFQYYTKSINDWLNKVRINKITFIVDGVQYPISSSRIYNECGWSVTYAETMLHTSHEFPLFLNLVSAKNVTIKLEGHNYEKYYIVSQDELKYLRYTFEYYKALGGAF